MRDHGDQEAGRRRESGNPDSPCPGSRIRVDDNRGAIPHSFVGPVDLDVDATGVTSGSGADVV
ncbi:MAG: hypothetical protein ACRDQ1_17840, partial [Sciscionella sp.]